MQAIKKPIEHHNQNSQGHLVSVEVRELLRDQEGFVKSALDQSKNVPRVLSGELKKEEGNRYNQE